MDIREIAKQVPLLPPIYRLMRSKYTAYRLIDKSTEEIFTDIFHRNAWGGRESVSGLGSDIDQTQATIKQLPALLQKFEIETMLDIPCGDFNWMKHVDLSKVDYLGADIVGGLIIRNTKFHERDNVHFRKLDLIRDSLPTVDLVLCRDCLIHLSFDDIFRALENICRSQSRYLLTSTYTDRQINQDIATGQWRLLNLEASPFELPEPLELINEACTLEEGIYSDKSLGLWRISDIQESLTMRPIRRANVRR
jgi:hypothetical protein